MSCRLCHFPCFKDANMGKMTFIGVRCQITWWPSLLSIGSLAELLIPILSIVLAPICFSKLLKDYSRAAEKCKICVLLVHRNLRESNQGHFKTLSRMFNCDFEKNSHKHYFSNIFQPWWENGKCNTSSEGYLEGSYLDLNYLFL